MHQHILVSNNFSALLQFRENLSEDADVVGIHSKHKSAQDKLLKRPELSFHQASGLCFRDIGGSASKVRSSICKVLRAE